MRHPGTLKTVELREHDLCRDFGKYVELFDHSFPFRREGQLEHHLAAIKRRYELGSVGVAVRDPEFIRLTYLTLQAWGMDSRAATLCSEAELATELRWIGPLLEPLEAHRIDDLEQSGEIVAETVWAVISELAITGSKNKIVSGTKTLHHCLPDLIPPMDRQYTRMFFQWYQPQFQNDGERVFQDIFCRYVRIAQEVQPFQYVGAAWRTSRTKILDNAVVAFCREHAVYVP